MEEIGSYIQVENVYYEVHKNIEKSVWHFPKGLDASPFQWKGTQQPPGQL